jgi:hypothetical protein
MRSALLLVVLLVAENAHAAESPQFTRLLPSTANALVPDESVREAKPFFEEWRREAGRFAEKLYQDEELKRRVGAPLDTAGVKCVLWTKMVEVVDATRATVVERCEAAGRPAPRWLGPALRRAQEKAAEECGNSSGGPDGPRVPNLGLRYLREWGRLQAEGSAKREAATAEAAYLRVLGQLVQAWEEAAAARGGLAPAGASLPLVHPCLLDKRMCPAAESAMGDLL